MVNIPPIPPLLCSTPPPIDFGEDDEDIDVLPHSLDGMEDNFSDFLDESDIKTDESIPSPRPPSVCDLPKISIYDGLQSPDEESSHFRSSSSPLTDGKINQDSRNNTKAKLAEAFNFGVRNLSGESESVEIKGIGVEPEILHKTAIMPNASEILQSDPNECASNSQDIYSKDINHSTNSSLSKNVKDLKIKFLNDETKGKITNITQNKVSIEDIEDDLSDDELYSPKSSKNFAETDCLSDYFKIEKIKTLNNAGNETELNSKNGPKTVDSSGNFRNYNISVALGNESNNELKSASSSYYMQNKYDMPPPLLDDGNDIDDDDFGEFADFQETHFINNSVPVNDINIKPPNSDLEIKDFNDFTKYNSTEDYTNANKIKNEENINESTYQDRLNNSDELNQEFNDLTSSGSGVFGTFQAKHEAISKQNSLDLQTISQEILTNQPTITPDIMNENVVTLDEKKQSLEEFSLKGKSIGEFIEAPEINHKSRKDIAAFSTSSPSCGNTNANATELIEKSTKHINNTNNFSHDDEFDDFADFELHQEVKKSDENFADNDDDDDDDFGDFNTAEPIATTASSLTLPKTSQNTITETPVLPSNNINERISKILQLMFSLTTTPEENTSDKLKPNKIQDIPFTSIDAAKALEYQWLISDTRHSFIRSLGIDSKNILFGDKWNPSLPRFAANLSFNPLKPIKNMQSFSSSIESESMLVAVAINNSDKDHSLEISGNTKQKTFTLDQKYSNATEETIEALKDNTFIPALTAATTSSIPNISDEPSTTEAESLKIFENPVDNEDKFSKTPPISEMESITTFSSTQPTATNSIEITTIDLEEKLKNTLNINQVVVTSTFSGTFKETHIYTPPPMNDVESKHEIVPLSTTSSSPSKVSPIDFDYEKAAMGVIIDETVVKKEYRDLEYNPPFTMDTGNKSATCKMDGFDNNIYVNTNPNISILNDSNLAAEDEDETNDDFSEFQSVSSDVAVAVPKSTKPLELPKCTTASHGGMILSPAILIPQAIFMESQKPKIEWGDSTVTINPEELARIEELFPEPRSLKSSNGSNTSQKSTPAHQMASTPSISATVAHKELEGNVNSIADDDDDDWSDFVSVTVTNVSAPKTRSNSPCGSPFQQRSPVIHKMVPATQNKSNNDDEWSEFVSSAPPSQQPTAYRIPQFNSGDWQHANFYYNIPSAAAPTHSAQKYLYNNNDNYNIPQRPYQMSPRSHQTPNNPYQQQVHIIQNFSTAPVPTPERLSATASAAKNNQFQSISSTKMAPSIALIPDLSFVAPAIPTHTSFINSLPKPSINMKK